MIYRDYDMLFYSKYKTNETEEDERKKGKDIRYSLMLLIHTALHSLSQDQIWSSKITSSNYYKKSNMLNWTTPRRKYSQILYLIQAHQNKMTILHILVIMPSVKVIVYTRPGNVMENDTHTLKNLRDRQNYV